MKIAIIGTGASGFGTALGLSAPDPGTNLTFFDTDDKDQAPVFASSHPDTWSIENHREIIERSRIANKRSFLPPKNHFGEKPSRYQVSAKRWLYKSENLGGLTRYWSANIFNFVEQDFSLWPISASELAPYYNKIAAETKISGSDDRLSEYFGTGWVNSSRITPLKAEEHLTTKINAKQYPNLLAGSNRLGIITDAEHANSCVYCGQCFSGCFRDSIFNSWHAIRRLFSPQEPRIIYEQVIKIEIEIENGTKTIVTRTSRYSGYDKVFLSAGCIATTEIVLRSLGLYDVTVTMCDNPVYVFPIVHPIRSYNLQNERYLAIASSVMALPPETPNEKYSHLLLGAFPDLMLRNVLPDRFWRIGDKISNMARRAVSIGKLYLHGDFGPHYRLTLSKSDKLELHCEENPLAQEEAKRNRQKIRQALKSTGYHAVFSPWLELATSAHYAGTLAYGNNTVEVKPNGEVMDGVYICDSSTFPESPAQPLTFTIMANAMRTAHEAIYG